MASAEHPITRSELREELLQYATKDDLTNLELRLTREIADLKSEFSAFKVEVKGDVNTLIKWMVGVQVGGIAAIAAIATAIITITKILGG